MPEEPTPQSDLPADLLAPRFRPMKLHLDRRDGLHIEWADGHVEHYSLVHLRRHCPCATCRGVHGQNPARPARLALTVLPANIDCAAELTDAKLVGNYALQITWADGHSTGIYDFRYLRKLGSEPAR